MVDIAKNHTVTPVRVLFAAALLAMAAALVTPPCNPWRDGHLGYVAIAVLLVFLAAGNLVGFGTRAPVGQPARRQP